MPWRRNNTKPYIYSENEVGEGRKRVGGEEREGEQQEKKQLVGGEGEKHCTSVAEYELLVRHE